MDGNECVNFLFAAWRGDADAYFEYNRPMRIIHIALDSGTYEDIEAGEYSNSSALELGLKLYDRFQQDDPIVISAPSPESTAFRGSSFFSIVFRSPVTSRRAVVFSNLSPGYSLLRLGVSSLVITGRARRLSAIALSSAGACVVSAEKTAGMSAAGFGSAFSDSSTDSYLAIGRAGENGVVYSSLISDGMEIPSDGLGYLFGVRNLKGISMPCFRRSSAEKDSNAYNRKIERSRALRALKIEGSCRMIDSALRLGWLPVYGYRDRFDPRAYLLDGKALMDRYGILPHSCNDCIVSCLRKTQDGALLPSWRDSAFLGSNLGFFSPESVKKLRDAAIEEGIDIAYLSSVLYELSRTDDPLLPSLRNRGADDYARIIHMIGSGSDYSRKLTKGIIGEVRCVDGRPVPSDLRGSFPDAIATAFAFPFMPLASDYLPDKPLSSEASAVMALYEGVYSLYLISMGYSPFPALVSWFGRFPSIIYRFPGVLRIAALSFRAYGKKGKEMLGKGLELLKALSLQEPDKLPERFISDFNGRTVPAARLFSYYLSELGRLEERCGRSQRKESVRRKSRDRRDRRDIPDSVRSAADGPSEDLGREGEPGLHI